jgi:RNA polymerase sigma-70 factor (ECF subfamily)
MVQVLSHRTEKDRVRPDDPDAIVVAAAVSDSREFATLYLRYVDQVYRYSYRRVGSPEGAEDVTSVIFTRALAALPAYRADRATFRSWLFAIAHNAVADEWRGRRPASLLTNDFDAEDPGPTPDAVALEHESSHAVRALLGRLPSGQADIVELRLAGLSGPEIATALGRSQNTVKVAQYRAYARLRTLLGEKESANVSQ